MEEETPQKHPTPEQGLATRYFQTPLNEFVYLRTYSRWIETQNRRETWPETVGRYLSFMRAHLSNRLKAEDYQRVHDAILYQRVMPSMRLLQFAGAAAASTHVCAYNCAYIAPTCLEDLGEILYLCLCGTGVGFSVETKNVNAFPVIEASKTSSSCAKKFQIEDSKEGWQQALVAGLQSWFLGQEICFDFSAIRPAGARLKTFGGRSGGAQPLKNLLDYTRQKIQGAAGRPLTTLELYDIICKIGETSVCGGVRRSALLSLSDLQDVSMRTAKRGRFFEKEPQRAFSNNSAVYLQKPTPAEFLEEWHTLQASGTGERGLFNRGSLATTLPTRRKQLFTHTGLLTQGRITGFLGTNPCGEIILQSKQFCNLTEVVTRPTDTRDTLLEKIEIATLLGTYQTTLHYFPHLSPEWKQNCEQERLLGVSLTGCWDCPPIWDPALVAQLKAHAIAVNARYAKCFEIRPATAITCIKPSGTVSQLVHCAPGLHPHFAPYYIRRIRIAANDRLFQLLKAQGVLYHPEVGSELTQATTMVLEFPVKAPEGARCLNQVNAFEQLQFWHHLKVHFTEHNPSVTIQLADAEWDAVGAWLLEQWDHLGGLSFLPRNNNVYPLMPFEAITKERYDEMLKATATLNFKALLDFESQDEGLTLQDVHGCSEECGHTAFDTFSQTW